MLNFSLLKKDLIGFSSHKSCYTVFHLMLTMSHYNVQYSIVAHPQPVTIRCILFWKSSYAKLSKTCI